MVHLLQQEQLVVDHLLVALDILLQDNFDGDLAGRVLGLPDDAVGSRTECSTEAVLGPVLSVLGG